MLVFITSIRHPRNCFSFKHVLTLLNHTLDSVLAQSAAEFKIIVVCNEKSIPVKHPDVEFLEVNFLPPSDLEHPKTGMNAIQIDRGCKYACGLIYAKRFDPVHVMFFDADDLLHRNIAATVLAEPDSDGWYIDQGYSFKMGASHMTLLDNFHTHCGTSHIVRYNSLPMPLSLDWDADQKEFIAELGESYIKSRLGSHRFTVNTQSKAGFKLSPLPFPGAIWVLGHGENHSGRSGQDGMIEISSDFRQQYGIPRKYLGTNK